ncbi:MAG: DNA repair protein RadA, partial [Oscillospiraceae bacterium]
MPAKDKLKTIFVCNNCGEAFPRWMGQCPNCNEWNTLVEDVIRQSDRKANANSNASTGLCKKIITSSLNEISATDEQDRIATKISELDRVLGGGIVLGSVVLLGGEPGAGKSTLLLQICGKIPTDNNILYITGEESVRQIKLRATRLKVKGDNIRLAAENDIEAICALIEEQKPNLVVIDSIQTMHFAGIASSSGSVSQVKECTAQLLTVAKNNEIPIFIVGHVNKDGAIAGPKVMEHIVDTVLYFEGDRLLPYRILRAVKNRYGSTNEIGMFDMTGEGLKEIENPSKLLLEGRPLGVSGNCVACTMEGTRSILSEIQALVTKSGFGTPRRASSGFDISRANLLLAVIEKRAGFFLGNLDVYINIVGGLRLDETACDLSLCLAVV